MKNIALIGFMATGKTTIGLELAKKLGLAFVDTDKLVEEKAGISISQIFQRQGEKKFRLLEKSVIEEVAAGENKVIATGGGVVLDEDNMKQLKRSSIIICLQANAQTIFARVGNDRTRPLLAVKDPIQTINNLLKEREHFYKEADIVFDTTATGIDNNVQKILNELQRWGVKNVRIEKS